MAKFGITGICDLFIFNWEPSGRAQLILFESGEIGTTFRGSPSNCMGVGGFCNSTNNILSISLFDWGCLYDIQSTTFASAPFVTQHSVASLYFMSNGSPLQSFKVPERWSDASGGRSQRTLCKDGFMSFSLLRSCACGEVFFEVFLVFHTYTFSTPRPSVFGIKWYKFLSTVCCKSLATKLINAVSMDILCSDNRYISKSIIL